MSDTNPDRPTIERTDVAQLDRTASIRDDEFPDAIEWEDDGEPLACGIENPDVCESCQ